MDQFDGDLPQPVVFNDEDAQGNRVEQNRKGCNKHYKDEVLRLGFRPRKCQHPENETVPEGAPEFCLEQSDSRPDDRSMDTYSRESEAVFYACESTVGRYGDEMARALSEYLEDHPGKIDEAVADACFKAGKCEKDAARKERKKQKKKGKKAKKEL
mmetsp:Transcript_111897/g.256554  ORF Transcript_111897/g.256554 Transcript_111897/m.256554 type:complete len:156 (+) Transcript_111897:299-766(+)